MEEKQVVFQVLMFDELKLEERPQWEDATNMVPGVCREHGWKTSLELCTEKEVDLLFEAIKAGDVHLATEATVGAIGVLSGEGRLYGARPVLVSGSCKRETGLEHAQLIQHVIDASQATSLRTISIASDGESRRGEALVRLTFKHALKPTSPLYPLLSQLPFFNLEVGDDDITADKDYKHVFKRLRNLLLREKGLTVHGVHIRPSVIRNQLQSNKISGGRINHLLNPADKQDVKLAFDLLREIWSLPPPPPGSSPSFYDTRKALCTLGQVFRHVMLPYICVDLSLSEQLTHLSAAAHLLLALVSENEGVTKLMPTQLYIDMMIMVKNVYFCVAKAKVDAPDSQFWITLLGTDRLETLFGILRTMIGNDANVDAYQLGSRLTGTAEVSTILAKHPEWDRAPRRLKLPVLSKDGFDIHSDVDHVNPASWRGNVRVRQVLLQTCWKLGCQMMEDNNPDLAVMLRGLSERLADLSSPLGNDLICARRDTNDVDDTLERTAVTTQTAASVAPDVEDAAVENEPQGMAPAFFEIGGKRVSKAKYLTQAFNTFRKPGSRDRLKRVADGQRYAVLTSTDLQVDDSQTQPVLSDDVITFGIPIVTLMHCDNRYFVGIGEVTDITFNGKHVQELPVNFASESSAFVSFQLLFLTPTMSDDDPTLLNDW
ncbi:hypothetical protein PC9H_011469 [Pleurotus ostreatus]|uniref:Uncharacterized protein n=1 Tax=Pleurotus ostreatus TaxID=5322 RepID=A0A8H6ZLW2_PLEOS|nr:uncharacterized protein PC9H_011469 [Pleurotus ostreatus]KAF7420950.1 hypothetical protein PC9H_011469 [Pleurotus ostreatus]KAJ8690423.1 hypothetical protein PTI98_011851 [Pleurotus ostreatus]